MESHTPQKGCIAVPVTFTLKNVLDLTVRNAIGSWSYKYIHVESDTFWKF
jgi:hypothetical protein